MVLVYGMLCSSGLAELRAGVSAPSVASQVPFGHDTKEVGASTAIRSGWGVCPCLFTIEPLLTNIL